MKNKGNKGILAVITIAVVAVSLLGSGIFSGLPAARVESPPTRAVSEQAVSSDALPPCMSGGLSVLESYHIHPHLRIVAEGKNVVIPDGIGSPVGGCERVIHTHDGTGTIHIEPNSQASFTLSDFFAVWGKVFSKDRILDYTRDAGHEIIMTVDGKPSPDLEKLVLRDKQEIMIQYRVIGEK